MAYFDGGEQVKKCATCGLVKDVALFRVNRTQHDGFAPECALCASAYQAELRERWGKQNDARRLLGIEPVGTRRCSKCQVSKDVAEFGRDRSTRSGLSYRCRLCSRRHQAGLRNQNRALNDARRALHQL